MEELESHKTFSPSLSIPKESQSFITIGGYDIAQILSNFESQIEYLRHHNHVTTNTISKLQDHLSTATKTVSYNELHKTLNENYYQDLSSKLISLESSSSTRLLDFEKNLLQANERVSDCEKNITTLNDTIKQLHNQLGASKKQHDAKIGGLDTKMNDLTDKMNTFIESSESKFSSIDFYLKEIKDSVKLLSNKLDINQEIHVNIANISTTNSSEREINISPNKSAEESKSNKAIEESKDTVTSTLSMAMENKGRDEAIEANSLVNNNYHDTTRYDLMISDICLQQEHLLNTVNSLENDVNSIQSTQTSHLKQYEFFSQMIRNELKNMKFAMDELDEHQSDLRVSEAKDELVSTPQAMTHMMTNDANISGAVGSRSSISITPSQASLHATSTGYISKDDVLVLMAKLKYEILHNSSSTTTLSHKESTIASKHISQLSKSLGDLDLLCRSSKEELSEQVEKNFKENQRLEKKLEQVQNSMNSRVANLVKLYVSKKSEIGENNGADIGKMKCLVCNQNINSVEKEAIVHAPEFKNQFGKLQNPATHHPKNSEGQDKDQPLHAASGIRTRFKTRDLRPVDGHESQLLKSGSSLVMYSGASSMHRPLPLNSVPHDVLKNKSTIVFNDFVLFDNNHQSSSSQPNVGELAMEHRSSYNDNESITNIILMENEKTKFYNEMEKKRNQQSQRPKTAPKSSVLPRSIHK